MRHFIKQRNKGGLKNSYIKKNLTNKDFGSIEKFWSKTIILLYNVDCIYKSCNARLSASIDKQRINHIHCPHLLF